MAESKIKKTTPARAYTRPNEAEMSMCENDLKNAIVEKTESLNAVKCTTSLLKTFAEAERQRPELQDENVLRNGVLAKLINDLLNYCLLFISKN